MFLLGQSHATEDDLFLKHDVLTEIHTENTAGGAKLDFSNVLGAANISLLTVQLPLPPLKAAMITITALSRVQTSAKAEPFSN